ncbi:SDR family oxidoreductase [Mycobacterium sp. AZCC_0083]|uniref:SDR family oxidoreductase n=1 Tax=Mycobacterium sp. AZCC_0083 TaxID=2735882 RepID=UPI001615C973|nr:SDR family oxidoreductase [Mycobacterium sp. AZCC_0083]MBB5166425.1 NAD(P)-dependent dehydrogenase (short-subunit alcohol dehydrogenase family) [Mycobacterium sp. AZCC_0083]
MSSEVLVVIGVGGMGQAIARRQGAGKTVLLADFNQETLELVASSMIRDGYDVQTLQVDVSSSDSVDRLARRATELGAVTKLVHTAGLSPTQASAEAVLHVDLVGVALVLEAFGSIIAPGGAGIVIASMAGHFFTVFTAEQERALAHTPAAELLTLPCVDPATVTDSALAYGLAKRANHIRVQAASVAWGRRGARVNSISPGCIATPMGHLELDSPVGEGIRGMVAASAMGRLGTPDEIAAAAAFLLGPDATFITGIDLLVDGGVVAAVSHQPA